MDKKKFGKLCAKIGTGFVAFAGTLVGGYVLTPNKVRTVNLSFRQNDDDFEETHFQQFVNRISSYPEQGCNGIHADFDNFNISFKTSDEATRTNNINLDAELDLVIRSLSDLDLSLDANIDYNGRKLPLLVTYTDKTAYFGLKDLRLKCSSTGFDELGEVIESLFLASVDEGGLGIDPIAKFESVCNEFVGKMDISSILSKFTGGSAPAINSEEEQLPNGDWKFDLEINMKKEVVVTPATETTPAVTEEQDNFINITIVTAENYDLKRVDLGTISFDNFTISGAIDFEVKPLTVYKPDDPLYRHYDANVNYVEIVSYKGWIKKLANLLADDNQKMSLSFNLDLSNGGRVDENTGLKSAVTEIGSIKGDINLDASELIDLSSWAVEIPDPYNQEDQPNFDEISNRVRRNDTENDEEEETFLRKVLNGIKLGMNLKIIGQNNVEYSNLDVKYLNNSGYIKFNEQEDNNHVKKSVLKAKVETETFNWILDELPNEIKSLGDDVDMSSLTSTFNAITDSELITSIKEGDYSGILDVLETLKNDGEKIYVGLNLSSLGLGDDAKVDLVLDSYDSYFDENLDPNHPEEHKVLALSVKDVQVGGLNIDFDLTNDTYQDVVMSEEEAATYDSLDFLPTVFDQVSNILKTKQSGFALTGDLRDYKNLGLHINGQGQFDYNTKFGFGNLTIDQYKYHADQVWYSHKIALDVDDKSEDRTQNNAKFIYGDVNASENIKGTIDIQSVLDIVDVIKTFIKDNKDDERYSKFIDPILELLGFGTIAKAIEDKNYLRLSANDLLKEIKQYDNDKMIKIVVAGDIFSLESDIELRVNFASLDNKVIDSIELKDLILGDSPEAGKEDSRKWLNLKLTLQDFNENAKSPIPSSLTSKDFISLASIKTLLQFGLNTTKLGYYKLKADISLSIGSLNIDTFPIMFHIVVKNSYVKVYGVIEDVPNFSVFVQDSLLTTDIKSELTFETYKDGDPNKTNDVGGYFTIRKTTDPWIGYTKIHTYRSTSKNFIKADNLLYYLLNGMLDIKKSYITGDLGGFDQQGEEKKPGDYPNALTSTGFKYSESAKRWDIGLNLKAITGISQLNTLEASIYASEVGGVTYLTRLYANLDIDLKIHLGVKADIRVLDIDPSKTDWDSSIKTAFNKINSYVFPSGKNMLDKLDCYTCRP